jgi:hypothetical protein
MAEMVRPRVVAGGWGNEPGLSGLASILPAALESINREKARLSLARAERAVNRPFTMQARLSLDRALLRAEALGVQHD